MIFSFIDNGKIRLSSLPLNSKTVSKYCRGSNSDSCTVGLIAMKPLTNLLYQITMHIGKDKASVTVTKRKFPYVSGRLRYDTESICCHPTFENDDWEFVQDLRKDLNNRKQIIFRDENTGRTYMAKCVKDKCRFGKKDIENIDFSNMDNWFI